MPYIKSEYDDLDKYESTMGSIIYYKKGTHIKHNICGPAFISGDGHKEYWINNEWLSKKEFQTHPQRLKY